MNQQDWYSELLTPGLEVLPRLNELHQAHLEIGVFLLPGKIQSQVLFLSSAVKATEPVPALCEASLVLSAPRADFQWIPASSLVFHGKLASALCKHLIGCLIPSWSYSILTVIRSAGQYLPSRTDMPNIGWLKFPNS